MAYDNILTKGNKSSLEQTSVGDGIIRFTQDTSELFVDSDGVRHHITDVIRGYTEKEIKSLLAPIPKIYLSSDTNKFLIYSSDKWIVIGKNEWTGTKEEFEQAVENGEISEGMTVYITDDYTGDGADLSAYAKNEYVDSTFVQKTDIIDNLSSMDTDKPLSANQGAQLKSSVDSLARSNDIATYTTFSLSTAGWYRIAKFNGANYAANMGASDNSVDMVIKRIYSTADNEHHEIKLVSVSNSIEFQNICSKSKTQLFTKIRFTEDSTNAYIEIYYASSIDNGCSVTLSNRLDAVGSSTWTPCLEQTDETVDGVTIVTTTDIAANCSSHTVKNLTTIEEGHALDATMGTNLQSQIDTLNTNMKIHKEGYDIETESGTEYQDCFVYTATEACFVLLNASSLYANFMPTGIQIVTNSNTKNNAVFPYFYVLSEGSDDWLHTMTSALVYLAPGSCVKVQQKISTDSGIISGSVLYIVIK